LAAYAAGRLDRIFMVYGGKTGDQNTIGEFYPPSQRVVNGEQAVSGGDVVLRWDHQLAGGSSFYVQGSFDRTIRATSQFTETRNTIDLDFIDHIANLPRQNLIVGAGLRESPSNLIQTQATVNFLPSKINNYVYSLFGQDTFSLIPDRLMMTLGSKFACDVYSGWGVQPTGQLLWRPGSNTSLWGSVARALRTPGRLDRDLSLIGNVTPTGPSGPIFLQVEGNPHFASEVLIGWSAGFRQLLWKKLYFDLAVFHNQYDNIESYGGPAPLITFPTYPYPYEQINIQFANGLRGVSDGLEIAPDWKPLSWLELRGSYSHLHLVLHSKVGFQQATYATGVEGSSPDHQASVQAIFTPARNVEIIPDYRYVSSLRAYDIRSYQTADAHIGYQVKEHLNLSITLTRVEMFNQVGTLFGSADCSLVEPLTFSATIESDMAQRWYYAGTPEQAINRKLLSVRAHMLLDNREVYRDFSVLLVQGTRLAMDRVHMSEYIFILEGNC
jgi:iron complex outermembrane receptor protein